MHKHITHNRCSCDVQATSKRCDPDLPARGGAQEMGIYTVISVTDNFRIISPKDFRVLT